MPPDVRADADVVDPRGTTPSRWRIHFWALQVVELGVAFLLVTQSVHVGNGGLLIGFAVVLGLLALTAAGPIGVFRICSQRLHVVLLVAVCFAVVALAFIPALRPDIQGLLVVGGAVIALVVLVTRTNLAGGTGGRRRSRGAGARGPVIDTTATVVTPEDNHAQDPREPRGTDPDSDSALRRAGRTTGAAAAAGKRAVDEHRPQVEHQVKRGLRGAGRLAGKLTGPKSPPADPSA